MISKYINIWWDQPKNFDDRKYERKISWLELFYDLVYVAAISQLTLQLSIHTTWQQAAYYFLLFCLIFWSWVNGSQYYDLHGNEGIRTRLFTFAQMLAVAAIAITIGDAFEERHHGFAIAFAVIQILITYLWWSVGFYDPSHRVFNKFYTFNYLIALGLIIASVFTNYHTATILWMIVLALNLTPPLIGAGTIVRVLKQRGQIFTASATIIERLGLFTIIVLAESILGTVNGIAEVKDKHPTAWIAFILGILIAFLLWSLYFDMTSEREAKTGYSYMQWLIFLHFPLLASLGVVGTSIKLILANISAAPDTMVQYLFCIAIVTILLTIIGLTLIMKEEEEDRSYIRPMSRWLIVISVIILLLPLFSLHTLLFLSIIAVVLFIPVWIGTRSWVRYQFLNRTQP